jgi:hypothetical protein
MRPDRISVFHLGRIYYALPERSELSKKKGRWVVVQFEIRLVSYPTVENLNLFGCRQTRCDKRPISDKEEIR